MIPFSNSQIKAKHADTRSPGGTYLEGMAGLDLALPVPLSPPPHVDLLPGSASLLPGQPWLLAASVSTGGSTVPSSPCHLTPTPSWGFAALLSPVWFQGLPQMVKVCAQCAFFFL